MAKKQNFIVGSTNPNTNTWTTAELNNGWDKYQVLKSGDLDGVFKAVSDYSNDSSQEIWNAIRILKGSNPTGASTSELGNIISTLLAAKASKTTDFITPLTSNNKGATKADLNTLATKATDFITPLTSNNKGATKADLNTLREEIETSSLTFKGYVATSAPSSSTYGLVKGNIWINASAMPTTFPVPASSIRVWNGTSWATTTDTYTVKDFDFFRNINNGEGYYWFGGQWVVMSTDMSTTYFTLNQTSGKWEIKSSVNLPGDPTTTTPAAADDSTRIATTSFVKNVLEGYVPTGGAANTDLDNLTSVGQNIGNWSSNVTNCITNIPQDIKLELNNGTLTLKAGSKVWVPDGFKQDGTTPKFYQRTIKNDIVNSAPYTNISGKTMLFLVSSTTMHDLNIDACYSGGSEPPTTYYSRMWFDTTNNLVKEQPNGWMSGRSLPIAILNSDGSNFISIDQVFNGFGYIGSTVFALPETKVSIPNGFNSDGTLHNELKTFTSVKTTTYSNATNLNHANIGITGNLDIDTQFLTYNEKENMNYNSVPQKVYESNVATLDIQNGTVTSFTPKTVFHAVDYSDFADLSNNVVPVAAIMPYAGTTAPAGYLMCNGQAVSRTTYSALFSVIGTAYGTGNGSTTFNLPSLSQGQTPIGMSGEYIGKSQNGCLPNITGTFSGAVYCAPYKTEAVPMKGTGAMSNSGADTTGYMHIASSQGANRNAKVVDFKASNSNSIYGNGWFSGEKVIPAGIGVSYIIKY